MRLTVDSKGDFRNVLNWLNDKSSGTSLTETMNDIGRAGVGSLSSRTPRDTGETASGWNFRVSRGWRMTEIEWFNSGHPGSPVNIAKLIELGHGTNRGGLVQPRPYIQEAMDRVYKEASDKIVKGMTR